MTVESVFTLRNPPHSYVHLLVTTQTANGTLVKPNQQPALDEITLRSYLNNALNQYFGITGTAIPIDIFKVEGNHAWLRLPRADESALVATLSQWSGKGGVSIRVQDRSSWPGGLTQSNDNAKLWSLET